MRAPIARPLQASDFADADAAVQAIIQAFNQFQSEVIDCLNGGIDNTNLARTVRQGVQFRSDAEGAASVAVATGLPTVATLVSVGKLSRRSGQPLGAQWAYSYEWTNSGSTEVTLNFIDLPLSADLVLTVAVE